MASIELDTINNGKGFPKLILEHIETKKIFRTIGGVSLPTGDKIALVEENTENKVLCSFETFEKNYKKIGYYD